MAAMYVVDTSVVIQRFVADTYTEEANVLLAGMELGDLLYIPEFCLIESTNVIWKRARFQGLPQTEADYLISQLLALPFQIVSVSNLLPRALRLGLSHELYMIRSISRWH